MPPNSIKNKDHVILVGKLLKSHRKSEAVRWLARNNISQQRSLGTFKGAKSSAKIVWELYAAGAVKVIAVEIKTKTSGTLWTEKLILELPSDAKLRASIFRWCKRQGAKVGYSPERDAGETHMYLLLS